MKFQSKTFYCQHSDKNNIWRKREKRKILHILITQILSFSETSFLLICVHSDLHEIMS